MKNLNPDTSLEVASIEALVNMKHYSEKYQSRINAVELSVKSIYKKYQARVETITLNGDKFLPEKIQDQLFNLRESTRQTLTELVKSRGFVSEIESCRAELEREDPKNDIQQMIQVMKEIELRKIMLKSGNDMQMVYQGEIMDGNPLFIECIEHSPVPMPIDAGMVEQGKKRRLEVLKPVIAKKFHLLEEAQSIIQGMAESIMPLRVGDVDEIRDLSIGE